jgi:Na+/proline symporter
VYLYGLGALWYFIGAIFGYIVFYFFAKKIKRLSDEKQYYTLPDFFFDKKGKITGYLVSLVVLLSMFGWVIVNFTGGAKVITEYSALSFELSIILMGVVILTYLLIGGFKAVVKTDIIQSIGISLLFILMIFLLFSFGGSLTLAEFNLFSIPVGQIVNFFLAGFIIPSCFC